MTTGRINQVAILGHTSGPFPVTACSDSTLSARLRGGAPPASAPELEEKGAKRGPRRGPHRSRATARQRKCKTAEHRQGGHCAAPRARRHRGRAKQAPPHRVPSRRNPPTPGRTANGKPPCASTPWTWGDASSQKRRGGEGPGAPGAGSFPRTRLRLPETGPTAATLPTPSSSSRM
jgi:hypothetical protein